MEGALVLSLSGSTWHSIASFMAIVASALRKTVFYSKPGGILADTFRFITNEGWSHIG